MGPNSEQALAFQPAREDVCDSVMRRVCPPSAPNLFTLHKYELGTESGNYELLLRYIVLYFRRTLINIYFGLLRWLEILLNLIDDNYDFTVIHNLSSFS